MKQEAPKVISATWRPYYDRLVEKWNDLVASGRGTDAYAREIRISELGKEPADAATEDFQRDQILGKQSLDHELLLEIEAALSRIEDGTYGICEATGEVIPRERLKAVPWTRYTVEAQAEFERSNRHRAEDPRGVVFDEDSSEDSEE